MSEEKNWGIRAGLGSSWNFSERNYDSTPNSLIGGEFGAYRYLNPAKTLKLGVNLNLSLENGVTGKWTGVFSGETPVRNYFGMTSSLFFGADVYKIAGTVPIGFEARAGYHLKIGEKLNAVSGFVNLQHEFYAALFAKASLGPFSLLMGPWITVGKETPPAWGGGIYLQYHFNGNPDVPVVETEYKKPSILSATTSENPISQEGLTDLKLTIHRSTPGMVAIKIGNFKKSILVMNNSPVNLFENPAEANQIPTGTYPIEITPQGGDSLVLQTPLIIAKTPPPQVKAPQKRKNPVTVATTSPTTNKEVTPSSDRETDRVRKESTRKKPITEKKNFQNDPQKNPTPPVILTPAPSLVPSGSSSSPSDNNKVYNQVLQELGVHGQNFSKALGNHTSNEIFIKTTQEKIDGAPQEYLRGLIATDVPFNKLKIVIWNRANHYGAQYQSGLKMNIPYVVCSRTLKRFGSHRLIHNMWLNIMLGVNFNIVTHNQLTPIKKDGVIVGYKVTFRLDQTAKKEAKNVTGVPCSGSNHTGAPNMTRNWGQWIIMQHPTNPNASLLEYSIHAYPAAFAHELRVGALKGNMRAFIRNAHKL